MARNLRVASQLWASATVFFFFAFLFAYFYLRSLNSQGLWHPHNVKAPVGLGTAIIRRASSCRLLASGYASAVCTDDDADTWRWVGLAALALGLAAVVLQVVEWATIGFGPTDGGFASVFLGWTGLYILFVFCIDVLARDTARHFVSLSQGRGAAGHAPGEAVRRRRANR